MTIARLVEQREATAAEQRALQMGYPSTGMDFADPSAIPPPGMYHLQRAGVVVTAHTLLQVDVVYTALRVISNNILRMGNLRGYTVGWDDRIGHEYKQFLKDQPPILTDTFGGGTLGGVGGSLMQCTGRDRTIWSMGLFGEAFWYILRDPKLLRPLAVEVLHPAFMEVTRKDGQVKYVYGTGQHKRVLEPENVIHIPLKTLPGANRALSPTDYAGVAGALAMAAYEFGSAWFSQGQSPSFILSTDQKLGSDEVERIADRFMIRHAGLAQAHTPVVVDSGIKINKVFASPDESQYLNTLEYARQVVGAWIGLPASKMPNALQRQQGPMPHARQEEQMSFITDTLSGYTIPLEEVHSALAETPACFIEDKITAPDAQFMAQLVQAYRITQSNSINDVRVRLQGIPPLPDEQAYDALAPLASNTAPSQTGNQGMFHAPGESNSTASDDEAREQVQFLLTRVAESLEALDSRAT